MFEIRHPDLARILYRAYIKEAPFPAMTEELRRRGTTQFFKQLITQGITHGEIAVRVDPDTAAFLMESIFYQFGNYLRQRLGFEDAENNKNSIMEYEQAAHILNSLMDLLEAGMKRNPHQRRDYYPKD